MRRPGFYHMDSDHDPILIGQLYYLNFYALFMGYVWTMMSGVEIFEELMAWAWICIGLPCCGLRMARRMRHNSWRTHTQTQLQPHTPTQQPLSLTLSLPALTLSHLSPIVTMFTILSCNLRHKQLICVCFVLWILVVRRIVYCCIVVGRFYLASAAAAVPA